MYVTQDSCRITKKSVSYWKYPVDNIIKVIFVKMVMEYPKTPKANFSKPISPPVNFFTKNYLSTQRFPYFCFYIIRTQ